MDLPDGNNDFLNPRRAEEEQSQTHSLAEIAVDAGTVDVTPATSSVEIVTEQPRFAPAPVTSSAPVEAAAPLRRTNYTRRDSLSGATFDQPEPAAMLTADRLLDASAKFRPAPESGFRRFLYFLSLKSINLGDPASVRARKAIEARIAVPLDGGARFVPVLTRKGGVGKTTISTLLGMALATAREDRIIAIDANPDRGTLAERVSKNTRFTVRDVVNRAAAMSATTL